MTDRLVGRRFVVYAVALLVLATAGAGADVASGGGDVDHYRPAGQASDGDVLVVDDDGAADYDSVQAAVDAADDGDTVRVRPGTYHESVTVDENVTLVAPRGATLDGSTLDEEAIGIEVGRFAAPVVSGFALVDYNVGVSVRGTTGDWELRDVTVENARFVAIAAAGSDGDWRVRNATIRRSEDGIWAESTTGDWRVEDTVIRNVTQGRGINALSATGDWTVENVTVHDAEFVGVEASFSSGDWRIVNSTVRDAAVGIGAFETSGDWTVWRSTVAGAATNRDVRFVKPPHEEGVGVYAAGSNGSWTIRGSRFADNEEGSVVAPDADPTGDAARNWWGDAAGPDDGDCAGNVDCGDPLQAWPPESSLEPPSTAATATAADDGLAGSDDARTVGTDAETTATDADRATATTTGTGPLSPVVAVIGLVLCGLLAGRFARSRR